MPSYNLDTNKAHPNKRVKPYTAASVSIIYCSDQHAILAREVACITFLLNFSPNDLEFTLALPRYNFTTHPTLHTSELI